MYAFCRLSNIFIFYRKGLWSSSFYLGAFLGPSIAGFLVSSYGFEWTAVIFSAMYCVAITLNLCELVHTYFVQKEKFLVKQNEDPEST